MKPTIATTTKVSEEFSFEDFAIKLRQRNLRVVDFSYGSGGYCLVILDQRWKKTYVKHSWNSLEALTNLLSEIEQDDEWRSYDEMVTLVEDVPLAVAKPSSSGKTK